MVIQSPTLLAYGRQLQEDDQCHTPDPWCNIPQAQLCKDHTRSIIHVDIVNSSPFTPVSTDPDEPLILTPAMLTQKFGIPLVPPGNFDDGDLFLRQWWQVQSLASTFLMTWRREYLSGLQGHQKWWTERPNLMDGDVVLLKDSLLKRQKWPAGRITKTSLSDDGKVRKVEVNLSKTVYQNCFVWHLTDARWGVWGNQICFALQLSHPTGCFVYFIFRFVLNCDYHTLVVTLYVLFLSTSETGSEVISF